MALSWLCGPSVIYTDSLGVVQALRCGEETCVWAKAHECVMVGFEMRNTHGAGSGSGTYKSGG